MTNVELKSLPFNVAEGQYQGEVEPRTRVPCGRGVFVDAATGSLYEGWRKKSKRCGFGRLVEASGVIYEGEWKENVPHGAGEIRYPGGAVFTGTFKRAKREGNGKWKDV